MDRVTQGMQSAMQDGVEQWRRMSLAVADQADEDAALAPEHGGRSAGRAAVLNDLRDDSSSCRVRAIRGPSRWKGAFGHWVRPLPSQT